MEDRIRVLTEFFRIMKPPGRLIIVEKTSRSVFAGWVGPPIINKTEVVQEVEQARFVHAGTISYKDDSLITFQKSTRIS